MINPLLLLLLRFSHCSFNHMTYKNRSCNTSYSARNRCDRINDWLNCRIINITTKLALCIDIDTNIDNSLSLSDIISADNTSTTSCNDDDIRLFATDGISTVLVWQIVTVAFFLTSIMAAGLPTTRLLPITTAFLPVQSIP